MKALLFPVLAAFALAASGAPEPQTAEIPQELQLISAVSRDWVGKPAAEVIAACGKPTKTSKSADGETRLLYRIPLQHGWTISSDTPTLREINDKIVTTTGNDRSPTFEPVMLPGAGTERPIIVGRLIAVFFVGADGKVRDVSLEQKLKKRYRDGSDRAIRE